VPRSWRSVYGSAEGRRARAIVAAWLSALVLCAASPASGETDGYARGGLYAGVGAAYVIEQFDLPDATLKVPEAPIYALDVDGGDSWGAEARVGYRFHPNLAAEGQLQYYDNFGIDAALTLAASPSRQILTLNGLSFMGNVKGYPFTGRVQPYGLVGLGLLWLQAPRTPFDDSALATRARSEAWRNFVRKTRALSDVGFAGRIGVGIDGYLTQNLLLNVETSYLLPIGDLSDFRMVPISLGVQYRFD
jgi:opacity protein-like surface antigen